MPRPAVRTGCWLQAAAPPGVPARPSSPIRRKPPARLRRSARDRSRAATCAPAPTVPVHSDTRPRFLLQHSSHPLRQIPWRAFDLTRLAPQLVDQPVVAAAGADRVLGPQGVGDPLEYRV